MESEKQLVIFKLAEEEFGCDINEIREITKVGEITPIPNTPDYIKGVINLRGKVIVVIDLANRFSLQQSEQDHSARIIVLELEENTIGMIVNSCNEVLRVSNDLIKEPPKVITQKISSDYIEGVAIFDERLIILLDMCKILDANEIEKIADMRKQSKEMVRRPIQGSSPA